MQNKALKLTKSLPVSSLEDHVGYWMRMVSNHVAHAFRLKVELHGVTMAEWVVMRQIFDSGDVYSSEIAASLGMTRGAITKLVDRLVAKGLMVRKTLASDRRYQSVTLSLKGRRLVPVLAKLADINDNEFFGHLSENQLVALKGALKKIVFLRQLRHAPLA